MSHVFICYSREDLGYAQRIVDALAASNLDTWVDWKSIPSGEDWVQEIHQGIEGADAFLFLLSPDSVESEMCNMEVTHAIRSGKRILPIFIADAERSDIYSITGKFLNIDAKEEINRRNFIFCSENRDNFKTAIEEVQATIHTDYEWVRYHTRLQVKAAAWKRNNHEKSFLLQGKELQSAETQLGKYSSTEPYPTDLQKDYVQKSRQENDRRKRLVSIISLLATVLLAGVALFGLRQKILAKEHELSTQARELTAQSEALRESNFPLALLLGVEAYSIHEDDQTLGVLRDNAQTNLRLIKYWFGNGQDDYEKIRPEAFSPDGKTLAISSDHKIFLRDVETGSLIGQPIEHYISGGVAFSPNGKMIAFVDWENNNILWNVDSGQPVGQPLQGHANFITDLAFSPNGEMLASADLDSTIILWNMETGKRITEFSGNITTVPQLVFRPDGKTLTFVGTKHEVVLWNIETNQTISRSFDMYDLPGGLEISPNGERVALQTLESLLIFDIKSGNQVGQPINTNTYYNSTRVFSPDGEKVATIEPDRTIILWDVKTGVGQSLRGHINPQVRLLFRPDGKLLVGGDDDFIVFWDLDANVNALQDLEPNVLKQKTCERVGRNFTQIEWQQYFPREAYRITCPQWPAGE